MVKSFIYDVVTTDVIWDCTNCRACMEHCPMFIEHIPKIVEMRRNLVMWQGDMPSEARMAFTNMERKYNPRGVSFGYLGGEEYCCGDSARRLGNEYLYQTLAQMNIESFNNYGVKKIITVCPHGYNALKNEYPQMGGNYEVYHYTEILAKLIAEGKLNPEKSLNTRVTYHDSCFLGRHNNVYGQPRQVIKAAGGNIIEIDKSKQFGFCCGAGGGRMWLEEHAVEGYKRINDTRTDQLLAPSPEMIVTNCPFCLTMITDGVKGAEAEEKTKGFDVAEVLWQTMQ